jgi:hypothetical protein
MTIPTSGCIAAPGRTRHKEQTNKEQRNKEQRTKEQTNKRTNEQTNKRTKEQTNKGTGGPLGAQRTKEPVARWAHKEQTNNTRTSELVEDDFFPRSAI